MMPRLSAVLLEKICQDVEAGDPWQAWSKMRFGGRIDQPAPRLCHYPWVCSDFPALGSLSTGCSSMPRDVALELFGQTDCLYTAKR
jgi:hypothetical protein